ncbi:MAG: hypothetical protein Q4A31_09085 [Corynebacterium sp.]|uniref:ABC transporter permease n=1 Tax=Corynebacterium sp. TaxID=1720 RepID=UPI0026DBC87F|nr:FtsX-like permease family protein [Corynebacterium sp.]MDO4762057.1 hypothetical protein [Corynebacterium sp.]
MSVLLAATRPTIRDIKQSWWRSFAAVVLIMLPVAFLSYHSHMQKSADKIYSLSSHETTISYRGGNCEQDLQGLDFSCDGSTSGHLSSETVAAAVGKGATADLELTVTAHAQVGDRDITLEIQQRSGAWAIPGMPELKPNEIVINPTQAQSLNLGVGDTLKVTALEPSTDYSVSYEPIKNFEGEIPVLPLAQPKEFTVVGISPYWTALVTQPALVDPQTVDASLYPTWLISENSPLSWADITRLNAQGYVVRAHSVGSNPQAVADEDMYPAYRADLDRLQEEAQYSVDDQEWAFDIFAGVLQAIGIILLLMLISPVFALASSRQSKVYSLMRSQGASKSHVRIAVVAYGAVAGLVGATAGVLIGAAYFVYSWKQTYVNWPFVFDIRAAVIIFVAAVLGAIVASFIPAIVAARGSIMAGVEGAQPDRLRRWRWWMSIGPVGLVVLPALFFFLYHNTLDEGMWFGNSEVVATFIWIVFAVCVIGSVLCLLASVPALIFAAGSLSAPLSAKFAARLVRRQALKSTAIVAAIIGLVWAATTISVMEKAQSDSTHELNAQTFHPRSVLLHDSWHKNQQSASLRPDELGRGVGVLDADTSRVLDLVRAHHGHGRVIRYYQPHFDKRHLSLHLEDGCAEHFEQVAANNLSATDSRQLLDPDWAKRCYYLLHDLKAVSSYSSYNESSFITGGPEILDLLQLNDVDKQRALSTLAQGGVLGSREISPQDTATFKLSISVDPTLLSQAGEDPQDNTQSTTLTLPFANVLPASFMGWIISPKALSEFANNGSDVSLIPGEVVYLADSDLRYSDMNALTRVLHEENFAGVSYPVEPSNPVPTFAILLAIAVLVVIGLMILLSASNVRRHNEQLYALGAPVSMLRAIGAMYAGLTAALGTVIPVILGHITPLLVGRPDTKDVNGAILSRNLWSEFSPDWWIILLMCVVVPLAAAGLGYISTRPSSLVAYRQD